MNHLLLVELYLKNDLRVLDLNPQPLFHLLVLLARDTERNYWCIEPLHPSTLIDRLKPDSLDFDIPLERSSRTEREI